MEADTDNRAPTVFVVTLSLGILATVFVALRVISKVWVVKRFTADDIFAVVAWVFATGVSAAICAGARVGLGEYDVNVRPEWEEPLKRAIYAFTVLYNPALMATKTSILVLYIRMAAAHRFLRYASIATAVIVNIAGIVLTFLGLFQCQPIPAAYTDDVDGTCIDVVAMYLASAPINILTDLAILCLPLPILTQLRMEFKQKCALVCTFIVGGFVAIVDVVRILYLQNALKETREFNLGSTITAATRPPNFTYHASFSLMWSAVEVSVGLMCCCVLVLKPLVMRVMPGFLGRERRQSRHAAAVESSQEGKGERSGSIQCAVSDLLTSPPTSPTIGGEEEEDDGMDFFQMLAADPAEPAPPPPAATRPHRLSIGRRLTITTRPIPDPLSIDSAEPSCPQSPSISSSKPRRLSIGRRMTITPKPPPEPSQEVTQNFFDFVNMKGRTPLTQLTAKEAWWPIMFVSSLFFLWGFAYGLLGTLNAQTQALLGYSSSQTFALHNAYWIGYFLGPPVFGYWTLTREGFKATFIAGLAIYSCGAMSYWPSSVLKSYPGFFISNVLVALGLSVLENAANPFVALAGPGHLSESRLCFSQGIQGVGSVISPLIANRALFRSIDEGDLFRVQYCYLAVALFVVALAVVFFYVPLSEVSDDELEAMATQRLYNADLDKGEKAYGVDARKLLLITGIVMMGTYVGAQESVSYFWGVVSRGTYPQFDASNSSIIAMALFAVARFLASGLTYFLPPRYVLFACLFGSFLTSLLAMILPQGASSLTFLILLMFFEAPIFPLIFAMVLRGQGKHTKFAATAVTMAIAGGATWPSVVYAVDMQNPGNPRYSIRVTTGLYAVAMLWPIAFSVNRTMRRWLDPAASKGAVAGVAGSEMGTETGTMGLVTPGSMYSKALPTHLEVVVEDGEMEAHHDEGRDRDEKHSGETLVQGRGDVR